MKQFIVLLTDVLMMLATTSSFSQTNVWDGSSSVSWGIGANWSLGHIPMPGDDVVIPPDPVRQPWIYGTTGVCRNLTIDSGATLTIRSTICCDGVLTASGNADISGALTIGGSTATTGKLIAVNISWAATSSCTGLVNGSIELSGNWEFATGAAVSMGFCGIACTGSSNTQIINNVTGYFSGAVTGKSDACLYNLLINKTAGQSVTLVGDLTCQSGGSLTVENGICNLNGYSLFVSGNVDVNDAGVLSLPEASILSLSDTRSLKVNTGGRLDISGLPENQATIRADAESAKYDFNVYPGGTIAADYCIFKNMSDSGLFVRPGATVDPAHSFKECTFRDGSAVLLTINNDQTLIVRNTRFPANTWGGLYNVLKNSGTGHAYFVDYTGEFAGEDYDFDPADLVDWVPPLTASATAFPGQICTGASSQLDVNRAGGLEPFTYLWSPPEGLSDPGIRNPVATPDVTTTYSVTVTDALGTTAAGSIPVTVNPWLPVGITIEASANPSPPGNYVTFTAIPVNGGSSPSYQWKKNDLAVGTGLPAYSDNTLAYNDRISCILTSNYLCPAGNPATSNTITMIIVATDATAFGTIPSGTNVCIDASNRITVAGPSGLFHIESGGRADLIAGNSIQYLYGTDVDLGGTMHGWITTTNDYCGSLSKSMVSAVSGVETNEVPASFNGSSSQKLVIYPNPTTGTFTLMNKSDDLSGKVTVAMFDMRGAGIFSAFYEGERSHQFNLNGLAPGLYFLKVATDNQIESFKLIVTR